MRNTAETNRVLEIAEAEDLESLEEKLKSQL